jgi:hypothetical protein
MRKSTIFLYFAACNLVLLALLPLHARYARTAEDGDLAGRALLARKLMITDLCLFTEARYTRHPSMADLHTPFQDHPVSLEHFPSGSLVSPPDFSARPHAPAP